MSLPANKTWSEGTVFLAERAVRHGRWCRHSTSYSTEEHPAEAGHSSAAWIVYEQAGLTSVRSGTPVGTMSVAVQLAALLAVAMTGRYGVSTYVSPGPITFG